MKIRKEKIYAAPFALFEKEPKWKGYLVVEREYDENGNLVKWIRFFEDGNVDEEGVFIYDDQSRLIEERISYALSDSTDMRRFLYDDEKRVETEIYYYGEEEGEKTLTLRNEDGDILEIRRLDESGGLINKERYEYFAKGKKSYEAEITGEGLLLKEIKTEYDELGREIRQEIRSADEMEIDQYVEISYEGTTEIANAYDFNGEHLYTRIRKFNENGQAVSFLHRDANGGSESIQEIEYDENGKAILVEWRTGHGDLTRKQETEYNEFGEPVKEFYFDLNPLTGQQTHQLTLHEYEYYEDNRQ